METFRPNGGSGLIALPNGAAGFRVERIVLDIPLSNQSDLVTLTIGLQVSSGRSESQSISINALVNFAAGMKVLNARYSFVAKKIIPGSLTFALQCADPNKSTPLEWVNIGGVVEGNFVAKPAATMSSHV